VEAAAGSLTMRRADWVIAAALFVAALLIVAFTCQAYGPTYDEPHYASAGIRYAEWWGRVGRGDFSALSREAITEAWHFNHEHPPLQKVASGVAQAIFGRTVSGMTAIRLPSALWYALVVAALFVFVLPVWGRAGALFSALALATLPRFFAHAHLVALDMPIACWFFVTTALSAVALERNSWKWALLAGFAFGLALGAKVNAFFLPSLLIPWCLIWYRPRWPKLLVILVLGPAVFFLSWPWLWIAPVAHFREYLAFHFRHAAYNVWYLNHLYRYAPWHYPFVITAVTTPVLVLLCAVVGVPCCWPRRGVDPRKALLLLGLIVTLLPSALPTSPKYNGERLFLPAFPFLCALSGGALAWVQARLAHATSGRRDGARVTALATFGLAILALTPGVRGAVNLHPYQLAYYNELVGGPWGATKQGFETIYWGQVFQESAGFLNDVPMRKPRVLLVPKGVIYLLEFQQRAGNLRADVRLTGDESEAAQVDAVMFQWMESDFTDLCWELVNGDEDPVHAVVAGDAPLLTVYDHQAVAAALDRLKTEHAIPKPSRPPSASSDTKTPTR
jgi:4-amino-4-deoxy-L-arabinose transferase-like glycosyltransferase